ncbi:hypothetical protein ACJX0J_018473, partial [Zea mays]
QIFACCSLTFGHAEMEKLPDKTGEGEGEGERTGTGTGTRAMAVAGRPIFYMFSTIPIAFLPYVRLYWYNILINSLDIFYILEDLFFLLYAEWCLLMYLFYLNAAYLNFL